MKLYIAGKMTGLPEFNFPAFFAAEEALKSRGIESVNPARHDQDNGLDVTGMDGTESPEGFDLKAALLWDLAQVADADGVYLLDGWETSKGAAAELALARALGKEIIFQTDPASEEVRTTSPTGGQKGSKAQRYDLIPTEPLRLLATLYGRGAEKYDDDNWRKGYDWKFSYAALQRHLNQFWAGEDLDEEMQLPHVISAAWHCFTLAQFMIDHPQFDTRAK
ncbi:dATP/dGTP diphosphohydrolase domain-containing protein [Subtercola vilae]|uniref:dATP/dGTP diphosphohydrolase domain-containing protein n=1 Tax=Subtercola vilae TaxID=2056433 RepID=UPI0019200E32|nr:dATP/dGTP diphosphohydrolase domain-containing protein [Subtercola vilae]